MPLQLTTPFDVGDADTADYTHAKIQEFGFQPEEGVIQMVVRLGTVSGDVFTPGVIKSPTTRKTFHIQGTDYDALVGKLTSATGVPIYNEVARELYQWLIDKGHYAGTIV